MSELNLTFTNILLGPRQTPWDLKVLLYQGAASIRRNEVMEAIDEGRCGSLRKDRIPFILKIHELFATFIAKGLSQATIINHLTVLWRFYTWVDKNSMPITNETVTDTFRAWTEYLSARVRNDKDISPRSAYKEACNLANLIARALNLQGSIPGRNLLLLTRMRPPQKKKKVLSTKVDKQNLIKTFEFGNILTKICNGLDLQTVRGELPIKIEINEQKTLILIGSLTKPDLEVSKIENTSNRL